jgi:hypothetical protein
MERFEVPILGVVELVHRHASIAHQTARNRNAVVIRGDQPLFDRALQLTVSLLETAQAGRELVQLQLRAAPDPVAFEQEQLAVGFVAAAVQFDEIEQFVYWLEEAAHEAEAGAHSG